MKTAPNKSEEPHFPFYFALLFHKGRKSVSMPNQHFFADKIADAYWSTSDLSDNIFLTLSIFMIHR